MADFITRFAPSPTGLLHLGHAYSALCAFGAARGAGGRFLLRIEDIDQTRCRPAYEAAISEDLAWLGLEWETPVRRQSEHFADYAAALHRLRDAGLVYRCFKTRKEVADEIARAPHLAADGPEGPQYIGSALPAAEEEALIARDAPFAWRLSMSAAQSQLGEAFDQLDFAEEGSDAKGASGRIKARPQIFGDPIIARKDAGTSYHLAAVHDDALQGVTHVIRGLDLFASTHLHRLLQALLDVATPVYRHHRLLADASGKRFAKRDRASTLRALRDEGASPSDIRRQLGFNW
ncbi:MAG: tRNA glutamyl-Q(34) synthetase GluQRS [Pseudomonadota bacterium]